jgi:hypothetical protein
MLMVTGGVSMGDRDLVKPLLDRNGTIHFGRVLMKPGKPLTFATLSIPAEAARAETCTGHNMMVRASLSYEAASIVIIRAAFLQQRS